MEEEQYERTVNQTGVRVTICRNRFEILSQPHADLSERQLVQMLKEWMQRRKDSEVDQRVA